MKIKAVMRVSLKKNNKLTVCRIISCAGMLVALLIMSSVACAADIQLPGIGINLGDGSGSENEVATAIKILLGLTVLSLAPAFLIVMTSFTRIIIVLSILRHAFGMQQTPPNTVLISLALFLTLFNL